MEDLAEIERIAGALIRNLSSPERRSLLRRMAREIRTSQAARIASQRSPDGAAFAPRKEKKPPAPGNYAVKFLYPKGSNARLVLMKSWVRDGPLITGFDVEAGAIRSFFWDKVDRWLPVAPGDQNKGAGKFRRQGRIRRNAMFRKLRNGRNLRSDASDVEAWIGFTGRAAEIARVHQEGRMDRPAATGRPVRYIQRVVLGLNTAERSRAIALLFEHLGSAYIRQPIYHF